MKTYLHGPVDYAKTLKLRFRVGNLDLTERRKRYKPVVERKHAQMCPCGKAVESRSHVVGEGETYKEERHVLEMRKIDECDLEKFGTLDSSEKTIAILGDKWWPRTAQQQGDTTSKKYTRNIWKKT